MSNFTELTKENFVEECSEGVVIIDFYAPWCGPCKMLTPILERVTGAKIGKVNIDEQPELAIHFNVSAIPKMVYVKDGAVVHTTMGILPLAKIQSIVDQISKL